MRRARNYIQSLADDDRWQQTEPNEIDAIIMNYFSVLFTTSNVHDMDDVINSVSLCVTPEMNTKLCINYTKKEIKIALKQMHPHKAPGPDDMNPFFYQRFWELIGEDVIATMLAILNGHPFLPNLNHTYVALIPKKLNTTLILEFRPISSCNGL